MYISFLNESIHVHSQASTKLKSARLYIMTIRQKYKRCQDDIKVILKLTSIASYCILDHLDIMHSFYIIAIEISSTDHYPTQMDFF